MIHSFSLWMGASIIPIGNSCRQEELHYSFDQFIVYDYTSHSIHVLQAAL